MKVASPFYLIRTLRNQYQCSRKIIEGLETLKSESIYFKIQMFYQFIKHLTDSVMRAIQ